MESDPAPTSEEKIRDFITRGHQCLLSSQYNVALDHFQSALTLTEQVDQPKLKLSCLVNTGACLITLGEYQRGISLLKSALTLLDSISSKREVGSEDKNEHESEDKNEHESEYKKKHEFEDKKDDEIRGDIYYNLGMANQGISDYLEAVTQFKQSIEYYIQADQPFTAADVYITLATCHHDNEQYDHQITALFNAQQLYHNSGHLGKEALVCAQLAIAYQAIGRKEDCISMLTTAKIMGLRLDDTKAQGQLYTQLGLVYSSLKMHSDAIQSFERALPLVRVAGAQNGGSLCQEAALLQNIGAVYNETKQYVEAVIYHKTAANLYSQAKEQLAEAKCLCNLALAQSQVQDYTNAAQSFSVVLTTAQSTGNILLQFQALEGLGTVCYHTQQYTNSVSYFEQALHVLDQVGDNTGLARERVMEKLSFVTEAMIRGSSSEVDHSTPVKKHAKMRKQRASSSNESKSGWSTRTPLTPIPFLLTPQSTARFSEGGVSSTSQPHGKQTPSIVISGVDETTPTRYSDKYSQDLQQYMNSYDNGSLQSSTLTSLTTTSDSSFFNSVFSAEGSNPRPIPTTTTLVPEGSLALGLNTKELYTVEKLEVENKKKGRKSSHHQPTRIVPINGTTTDIINPPTTLIRTSRSSVCTLI